MFTAGYFAFITAVGYYVLEKTDFLPHYLGGQSTNDLKNVWKGFPVVNDKEYAYELKFYYLMTFGYHIKSLYTLFAENQKA